MEDNVNVTRNFRRIRLNHIRNIARTIHLNVDNQVGDYPRTINLRTVEQPTSPLHNMAIDDGASDGGQERQISLDSTIHIRDQWRHNYRVRRASLSIEQVRQANARRRVAYRDQRRRLTNEDFTTVVNEQVENPNDRTDYVIPIPHGEGTSAGANNDNRLTQPYLQNAYVALNENEQDNRDYHGHPLNPITPIPHGEGSSARTNDETPLPQPTLQNNQLHLRQLRRRHYNSARNFRDVIGFQLYRLPNPRNCCHCNAKLFHRETSDFCCLNGKTTLPHVPSPPEIRELYNDQTPVGIHFRKHIRSYNHIFSFTSMGVHVDESLANGRDGVYTFRAQGSIYHKIGSMLPTPGDRPRFLQMYIYDTDHEIENRLTENNVLNIEITQRIKDVLDANNPFVGVFRQLAQRSDLQECKLIIKEQSVQQHQYSLPTTSQVAAIVVGGENDNLTGGREIIVESMCGQLTNVPETAGYYDPLQYPLLLPYGSYGWDLNSRNDNGRRVTCRDYYCYLLQIRPNDNSLFLHGCRLFQQYVVDNYVKIDSGKLRWLTNNQSTIRAEMYQGLQDALNAGENNADNVGRRTILPSSYHGSPRDMYQRYQDAMALVQKYGKLDLFITMTCNPGWDEITSELLQGQTAQDRPDLTTRVFRSKFEELKKDIYENGILGKVVAHVHVIEFQKRGLPHVHMLIILSEEDKLTGPDDYDQVVRAEIPDPDEEPELYRIVLKWMIHGPCQRNSPCRKHGPCKRNFPKPYADVTLQGNDSFPIYRRRDTGRYVVLDHNRNVAIDNRWVVPYNPWLLRKYDCHINVEVCSSILSVKYLYKYVYKGPDCVALEVRPGPQYDEIQQFVDARWICAPEALWRIYKFSITKVYPSVERLQIHLPNRQQVHYYSHQSITNILSDDFCSRTMLTAFFDLNSADDGARQYLYREIPEHYRWVKEQKIWQLRRSNMKSIGRIYTVHPSEGDRFFLRILLNHVVGPKSFNDLLTVGNTTYPTFKQAAEKLGLLEEDRSVAMCLAEASTIKMPSALRRLFATILVYCQPTYVRQLWDEFWMQMAEDYPSNSTNNENVLKTRVLRDINSILVLHNKSVSDFDLPELDETSTIGSEPSHILQTELSVVTPEQDFLFVDSLNDDQKIAYDTILSAIRERQGGFFFIDGPGGTGKTNLYRAILASIRKNSGIALATATSGIAATILPGGRTAHSRFKLPLSPKVDSTCLISKRSDIAQLIENADVLIWDEITMTHRYNLEALDKTLRDILDQDVPFGGKVLVTGGDFRQVLPVLPRSTRSQTLDACIIKSNLWNQVIILSLRKNMRAIADPFYSNFLLKVGNGEEPYIHNDFIRIPHDMVIPWENEESINQLIEEIFPNLSYNATDKNYIVQRSLITPLNEHVNKLNNRVIQFFPGDKVTYYSFDSVEDDTRNLYQQEFLNNLSPAGLPPHKLVLKLGAPIMLVRNLDPTNGLCNGTRLICRGFERNVIHAEIVTGNASGECVFLPRIPMKPSEDANLSFQFVKKQFPVKLSFALTINKAQGQTIQNVGIYLPTPVFSHGQLYVALSRGVSKSTTKVMIKNGELEGHIGTFTKNIVYKEVLVDT